MSTFLIEAHGLSSAQARNATGLVARASIAGSLVYGLLADRVKPTTLVLTAAALQIASALPAFEPGFGFGVGSPRLVPYSAQIGPENGLIAQLGRIGAFTLTIVKHPLAASNFI